MPVTEELQEQIASAEQNFREKKYDEALAANEAAIAAAKDATITKDNFPLALLTRLIKITRDLGEWSRDRFGSADPRGILITLAISHETLAGLVGASRQQVTEYLNEFDRENIISRDGRRLIVNLKKLRKVIDSRP